MVSPPRDRASASRSLPGLAGLVPAGGGFLSFDGAPCPGRGAQPRHRQPLRLNVRRRLMPRPGGVLVRPHDRRIRGDRPRLAFRLITVGAQPVQIFSQVPYPEQRRCRLYTVFQFPNRSGRSRHRHPVRTRQNTPSITTR